MKIKYISAFLVLMLMLVQLAPCASAAQVNNDEASFVDGSEKNELIDELFSLRLSLEHDYEKNQAQIEAIDHQLEELGIEFLETAEASDILSRDGVAPAWLPQSTSSVRWTSRNLVTTYAGYQYDIQVIEGVPISENSPLIRDNAFVEYEAEGITAGVTKVILATIVEAGASYIGENLSRGLTLLDLIQKSSNTLQDSVSSSTVFDNVSTSAKVSFAAHMRYIYVKPYDTPEEEYQGLYYFGNSVTCTITTVTTTYHLVNGEIVIDHDIDAKVRSTIQSQYYDDYSHAAAAYWDYNYNYNSAFRQDYTVYAIDMTIHQTQTRFYLPWVTHPTIIR